MTYRLHLGDIVLLCFDHSLKIDVDLDAKGSVILFPHRALLLDIVHSAATLFSVNLQTLYLVKARGLLWEGTSLSIVASVGIISSYVALIAVPRGRQAFTSRKRN